MTVEFKEEEIVGEERFHRQPYAGYFAPNGDLVDFNEMFGGRGHDDWQNIVSQTFLFFVSYAIKGTSIERLKRERSNLVSKDYIENVKYPGLDEYVIRGLGIWLNYNLDDFDTFLEKLDTLIKNNKPSVYSDEYFKFRYQLLLFFKNAYANKSFFETVGRKIEVSSREVFASEHPWLDTKDIRRTENLYRENIMLELMKYFKDIAVMYLGYDSIERFKPDGKAVEIPSWNEGHKFNEPRPRIITSSYPNINERYYNYLLMDWDVHRLPNYIFNEKTGLYEKSDFNLFYQSETEENLGKEIQSIKKLVPLKERQKYFR